VHQQVFGDQRYASVSVADDGIVCYNVPASDMEWHGRMFWLDS